MKCLFCLKEVENKKHPLHITDGEFYLCSRCSDLYSVLESYDMKDLDIYDMFRALPDFIFFSRTCNQCEKFLERRKSICRIGLNTGLDRDGNPQYKFTYAYRCSQYHEKNKS